MPKALSSGARFPINLGPFGGVFDTPDAASSRPTRLSYALNMVIPDPKNGSDVVQRHGFVALNGQLGDVTDRTGQNVYQHRRADGTIDRFMFAGGKMYYWDGTDTIPTNITPGGVTISPTNRIFCASYNGLLIVSDETNKPWTYNHATTTAALIQINAANDTWNTKGGPVIYGGKVFFVLKTKAGTSFQNSIVWSEELTPTIGYQQTGYSNFWQLAQTSNEHLGGIAAEESGLVYFRNKGIGVITGAVNSTFATSATRDSVSTTIGTDAPASIVQVDQRIFFIDLDGRPFRMTVGGGEPQPLWYPLRATIEKKLGTSGNRANVALNAAGVYHEGYNMVLFTIWDRQTIYAFDATTGAYIGIWGIKRVDNTPAVGGILTESNYFDAMGAMADSLNRPTIIFLATLDPAYGMGERGYVWRQKHPDDNLPWIDQYNADDDNATVSTDFGFETHWLTASAAATYRALEIDAQVPGNTASDMYINFGYVAPGGNSTLIGVPLSRMTGDHGAGDGVSTARLPLGPSAQGTAIRLVVKSVISNSIFDPTYRFGVNRLTITAMVTKARHGAA